MKVTRSKKSHAKMAAPMKAHKGPLMGIDLQDNGDDTVTVFGVDAAGNKGTIDAVATLPSVVSSDPTKLTVDPPVGMTYKEHAVGPLGSVTVAVDVAWNDGSVGPFHIDDPVNLIMGPVNNVVIEHGTPTTH